MAEKRWVRLPVHPETAAELNEGRKGGESWDAYLKRIGALAKERLAQKEKERIAKDAKERFRASMAPKKGV